MEILHVKKHGRTVSSFLKKTYQMLQDNLNDSIVKWTPDGVGFMVIDQAEFSKVILPKYFKHNKYSSFVRQLNMYNFHKVRSNANQNCFIHENFVKNNIKSIENIKRKPERKKKKTENDSISCDKQELKFDDIELQEIKPQTYKPNYFNHNHKIRTPIANRSLKNDEILLQSPLQICLNTNSSYQNTVNQKQSPVTGIELQDSDDNISIVDGIQMIQRSQMKIPTRLLLHNEGSGIFPLNTDMISIYSMSSLIK